ncbi:sensor histidine kinase [Pararhodospirillum oryzae]|uniref:histidine kinase n=1 Tax=Pararhodospirillum oryzae TaxID=478448 RepID=A0A512H8Y0_9PROT|nr:HAMP domain-containing sensor histidine kinase [Pararhodospirillum oryzae]GEO81909.1 two-component sensor histidine kinase [Pararhodospirillum oryzae]
MLPRSTALRIALSFVILFGGASALLMGGVYLATSQFLLTQVDQAIEEDVSLLMTAARVRGPHALASLVVRRARLAGEARSVFLLAGPDRAPLAGNLAAWPEGLPAVGWATVARDALQVVPGTETLAPWRSRRSALAPRGGEEDDARGPARFPPAGPPDDGGPPEDRRMRDWGPGPEGAGPPPRGWGGGPGRGGDWEARPEDHPPPPDDRGWFGPFGPFGNTLPFWHHRPFGPPPALATATRLVALTLPGDFLLVVGRDLEPVALLRARIGRVMRGGLLVMVILGLAGGVVMSRRVARRLEAVNRTSREIMAGDLSRRVPEGRGRDGDDFDQLAANLNAMLARIETLMAGVRHVSDTIAHDLRTPLARLRNRLEGLRDGPLDEEDTRDGLSAALAEVDGLLATFHALLRIAQVESGGRRVAFEPLDLAPLLGDVAELYEAVAAERDIVLETTFTEPARVDGDRDLLFQAFANLLDNAVKYSPAGGLLRLTLGSATLGSATLGSATLGSGGAGMVRVVLDDQGPGIPPADRARVFERFARLDEARATPGNGLGLTMVGAVIEAHGGTITLDDAPGGGLRVIVTFPVATDVPARRVP